MFVSNVLEQQNLPRFVEKSWRKQAAADMLLVISKSGKLADISALFDDIIYIYIVDSLLSFKQWKLTKVFWNFQNSVYYTDHDVMKMTLLLLEQLASTFTMPGFLLVKLSPKVIPASYSDENRVNVSVAVSGIFYIGIVSTVNR